MAWWYGLNFTCPQSNRTVFFLCANGHCINDSNVCDGIEHCTDGSDEDLAHAQCQYVNFQLSGTVIAGIVIGTVVGIAIMCCVVGTIVDCFVHIYKYWCSCLHKAYHYPTEMIALRTPRHSPTDPSVVVVRALPPSYSTVVTNCDSPTDSQTPMLQGESSSNGGTAHTKVIQNGEVARPRNLYLQLNGGKDYKHTHKRDLMKKVSRAAIRDCIPDIESDIEEESEEERDKLGRRVQLRSSTNIRPQDLIIKNKHTFLTMEYANEQESNPRRKRSYGVDTRDLTYYESNISAMRDNSIGTSTRDLSRFTQDGTLATVPQKTTMVSKDIQTDEVVTFVVPNQVFLPPSCADTSDYMKKMKEKEAEVTQSAISESTHLFGGAEGACGPMPPSYSSIFQNGNLIQLNGDVPCCNGVVDLPPKKKPPPE